MTRQRIVWGGEGTQNNPYRLDTEIDDYIKGSTPEEVKVSAREILDSMKNNYMLSFQQYFFDFNRLLHRTYRISVDGSHGFDEARDDYLVIAAINDVIMTGDVSKAKHHVLTHSFFKLKYGLHFERPAEDSGCKEHPENLAKLLLETFHHVYSQ